MCFCFVLGYVCELFSELVGFLFGCYCSVVFEGYCVVCYSNLLFVVSFIEHYVLTSKFNHVFTWSSHFADANDIPFYFLDFIFSISFSKLTKWHSSDSVFDLYFMENINLNVVFAG